MTSLPSCLLPPPRPTDLDLVAAPDLRGGDIIIYDGTLFELDDVQRCGNLVQLLGRITGTVSVVVPAGYVFHRAGRLRVWV